MTETEARESAIRIADDYLNKRRVSEPWRIINMLRDQIVRDAARSAPVPADAALIGQLEGVKALLGDIYHHGLKMLSIDFDPAYEALEDAVRALRRSAPVGTSDAAAIRALEVYYDDEGQQFDAEGIRRMRAALEAVAAPVGTTAVTDEMTLRRSFGGSALSNLMRRDVRIALAAALEAVSVPHPEPEWEYAAGYEGHNGVEARLFSMSGSAFSIREAAEGEVERYADPQIRLIRRSKPGPWEVAP